MKNFNYYLVSLCFCFFAGCGKKIKKHDHFGSKKEKKISTQQISDYQQLLALHDEIPDTLLGFQVVSVKKESVDSHALEVLYKPLKNTKMTAQEVKQSYVADMEMLGWKMIGEFDGENIQLIFQKAGTKLLSTVIIEENLEIRITIYSKK